MYSITPGHLKDEERTILRSVALAYRRGMRAPAESAVTRAEIRVGELLREVKERGERRSEGGSGSNQHEQKSLAATIAPTLSDLGITKTQSSRWQKLAAAPADELSSSRSRESARGRSPSAKPISPDPILRGGRQIPSHRRG